MSQPGSILAGRFELLAEAGSGGMGTVYRARDLTDGAIVGVKLLRTDEVSDAERFAQESVVLSKLSHPGIVRYISHGVVAGDHFMAMEWLEGEDLAVRIEREPLRLSEALEVVRRAASALAYAHSHGVVHRDIKPQNLFLPHRQIDRMKLIDFGIARLSGNVRRLTQTGLLVGTPGYLAPELIENGRTIDGRADVFSLGCVVFECITGRPVFKGHEQGVLLAKILLDDAPPLAEVAPQTPPAVCELVARMLDKNVARRPSAGQLLEDLGNLPRITDRQPGYPRMRRTSSLTVVEQRVSCIVMAGNPGRSPTPAAGGVTLVSLAEEPAVGAASPDFAALEQELSSTFEATLHKLPDGKLLLTLPEGVRAADQATIAARCALRLRDHLPEAAVVVAMGVARFSRRSAVGTVIDTAARLLRVTPRGHVRIDPSVAALVDARFELYREGTAVFLRGQRDLLAPRPNLLGRPAAFVGRGKEISSLAGLLTDAVTEGKAGAVLVTGPAGIGKTRVLQEFLVWVHERPERILVLLGTGDSLAAGAPFAMIGRALRRWATITDSDSPEERRRKLEAAVARRVAPETRVWVTMFLGEIAHVPFPDSAHEALRAARGNPQLMADVTRRAWEEWLRAECAAQPVLLVLEDLQWGDAGTASLVDGALRILRDAPFVVVALGRPDVHAVFPNLWAERPLQVLPLTPLSRKAGERLVREALGAVATDELVAQIVARADGNPFYLEEMVRAAHEGRVDAVPAGVLSMVQARLDGEGADAKRVLRAASVFGDRFSRQGLVELLGGEREIDSIDHWLEHLASRELIARTGYANRPGAPEYTFSHALVREAAYAMLTEEDRPLGHRLAGAHLEKVGHSEAIVLAEHFWRGGEAVRAAPWYRRASEEALQANDLAGAVARANLGLAALAEVSRIEQPGGDPGERDETRGALLLVQAEAHLWRGELARAELSGEEALACLSRGSVLWFRAAEQTIVARGRQGKTDALEDLVKTARATSPVAQGRDAFIICLGWAASFLLESGRFPAADKLLEEAVALAGNIAELDPEAAALIHQARAARASTEGDLASCLDELEAGLAAFEQAGDVRSACAIRSTIGTVHAELGEPEQAVEVLREAHAAAERLGLPELAAVALQGLGRVLGWSADPQHKEEAERTGRRAVELFWAQGELRREGLARAHLSEVLLTAQRLDEAHEEASAAVRALSIAPALQVFAQAVLARVQLARGRAEEALAASQEAHTMLGRLGLRGDAAVTVALVHAEVLRTVGRVQEAHEVAVSARVSLLARAARVGDAGSRHRFLTVVPHHARLVALADALERDRSTPSRAPAAR